MKMILKTAFAVAALSGATALVPDTAMAGVNVSVGIPVPGLVVVSPYGAGYVAYDDEYYYEPIFIGGAWYHGPYRWQMRHGERMFFVNGRWHRDEWRGVRPNTIMFRNGGSFRDGHNIGFRNADRINARFRPGNSEMRQDRREMKEDRKEMHEDRRELRDDRHDDRHDDHSRN